MGELGEYIVTDKEFNGLLDEELESINKHFEKPQDSYLSCLKVMLKNKSDDKPSLAIVAFAGMPEDSEDRRKAMRGLGVKFWQAHDEMGGVPVAIVFTAEAWMKKFKKGEEPKDGKVSGYADKEECLVTYGLTIDGRKNMAMHTLTRNKKGDISKTKLTHYSTSTEKQSFESGLVQEFYIGVALAAKKENK